MVLGGRVVVLVRVVKFKLMELVVSVHGMLAVMACIGQY